MNFSSICRCAAFVLCVGLAFSVPSQAATLRQGGVDAAPEQLVNIGPEQYSPQIVVPAGKSRLVHFDRSFRQIVVGSKDIAHVVTLSRNSIYILGKKRGTTNLTITDSRHAVIAVVDVIVSYDVDGLRRQLANLVPGEHVDVSPAGDALVLSGEVASAGDLQKIVAIANRYAPNAITNLLKISGSQQVMLSVKFSEVQRSALQNLGVSVLNGNAIAGPNTRLSPNTTLPAAIGEFGTYGGLLTDLSTYDLRGKLNADEKKGLVRTLAEPNLVALTGESASFLAGGEFPIPVVQSSTNTVPTTTIQYKDFGVGLSFTPTVVSTDTVNLAIKSEVSALDSSASVTTSGITVPGLKVRRAKTTVEMHDGQTFAIAGLIQDDFQDTIDAIPGLGDVPVLGALFRSVDFQHNRSELVIFITVHLVKPVEPGKLQLPTDKVQPPTLSELDAFGHTEHPAPSSQPQVGSQSAVKSEGYVLP